MDVFAKIGALLAQSLSVFGLVPNFGLTQFQLDFRQAFLFAIEVKDTPGARAGARNNP